MTSDPQWGGETGPPKRWSGWTRKPRGRWRCLVHGGSSDALVLEELRRLTARERHVDLCVLPADRSPNDR